MKYQPPQGGRRIRTQTEIAMAGQPPTSRLLLTSVTDFVRASVKSYPFPDPSGKWLDCRVFLHGIPEDQDADTYPFVIARWVEGEITSEPDAETILKDAIGLVLGVHAPRSQAEAGLLCAELLDVLRRAFWKERVLAGRFELLEPLTASIPAYEQKVHRFHLATLETVWTYVWPPKALELAGISQGAESAVSSYSQPILAQNDIF